MMDCSQVFVKILPICHHLLCFQTIILKYQALVTRHYWPMCSHERRARTTFNLTGHDMGQEPLVTEMAFLHEGMCVMYSVGAHFHRLSLCMPQTSRQSRAARLSWREDLMLLYRSLHHPQTERDTLNQLLLLLLLVSPLLSSHWSKRRSQQSLFSPPPSFSHTQKRSFLTQLPICCPLTLHWSAAEYPLH